MALAAYWQRYCQPRRLGVMKLIQTGQGDRELYSSLFQLDQTPEELNPLYFQAPLAPPLAAAQEGRRVDLEIVWRTFETLSSRCDFVLVEALGGLGCPLTSETTVADLAWDWRLPTVLVVPVRLGAISQAVANVALAQVAHAYLKGMILNCVHPCSETEVANWTPTKLIQSLTNTPILGRIPHLTDPTNLAQLTQAAADLDIERLLPLSA